MSKSPFNINHQNKDLPSKIVAGLERVSGAFRRLLWDHAKELGLSPIQIQILLFVRYHREELCNVSAIAKEFNVTKPTVSDAVRVLHQKGLIEKSPSNADRRAYSVAVSQKGQSVVAQTEQFADPVKSIVEQLGTQTQEQFFIAISKIISLMNKADILTVQRTCFNCRFYSKSEQGHYCKFLTTTLKDEEIRIDCPEHEEA